MIVLIGRKPFMKQSGGVVMPKSEDNAQFPFSPGLPILLPTYRADCVDLTFEVGIFVLLNKNVLFCLNKLYKSYVNVPIIISICPRNLFIQYCLLTPWILYSCSYLGTVRGHQDYTNFALVCFSALPVPLFLLASSFSYQSLTRFISLFMFVTWTVLFYVHTTFFGCCHCLYLYPDLLCSASFNRKTQAGSTYKYFEKRSFSKIVKICVTYSEGSHNQTAWYHSIGHYKRPLPKSVRQKTD